MTRRDLLRDNRDLLEAAGYVLGELPRRRFRATVETDVDSGELQVAMDTRGIDRVDFYDDARPIGTVNVDDGVTDVSIAAVESNHLVLHGFLNQSLVAAKRILLDND
jgi:hypothetical protein